MRGRKPQPTALKVVKGNPGKRALPKDEPSPEPAVPDPPAHLSDDALAEWKRVAVQLYRLGILADIDMAVLAAYCQSYGRWVQAERALSRVMERLENLDAEDRPEGDGLLRVSAKGNVVQQPLIGIANKAAADMVRYATEFGMGPASRSRVKAMKAGEGEGSGWESF